LATATDIVVGTFHDGDDETTVGSIAKAINDITTGAATVISITTHYLTNELMLAIIVYTEQ
jgi:hypothetical protein